MAWPKGVSRKPEPEPKPEPEALKAAPEPERKLEEGKIVCNRCKNVYNKKDAVKREQQDCCPVCLAPSWWEN